jgi:NAD(P)-dependent dehydrogenase (short-subunit alcohol dehydrogenase family)
MDKIVVITGGSSGIGLAAAHAFEREGAKVVVTGRAPEALEDAAKALGKDAIVLKADVTREADLDLLIATVGERHGRIDVLFANAGVAKVAPLESTSAALFDEIMGTNFRGAYFTVQKALPLITDGGAILFTTSYFDQVGIAGTSVVSASKAALRSLTRTLAAELLPRKIRVNAISPGVISTPLFGKLGLPQEAVNEIGQALLAQIPVKRFGTADEIAKAVTFLASDDASYITGSELTVDGGRTEL